MGFLNKMFGGKVVDMGTPWKCGECGATMQMPSALPTVQKSLSGKVSLHGMAGYCPLCGKYICSKHLEFVDYLEYGPGLCQVGCKRCKTPVTTGP
jgi:hypothetical protein